ncbi:MAG: TIR domain-containing protein [archaeon]|nr:TIR domain-containing protein [archaeon]
MKPKIFISHCWDYRDQYYKVEEWIDDSDIDWQNMSIPVHDPKDTSTDSELEEKIDNNIRKSSLFIILSGMYVSQSNRKWINKELNIANKYGKNIIAVKPWGNEKMPLEVQKATDIIVNWNSNSLIESIKENL